MGKINYDPITYFKINGIITIKWYNHREQYMDYSKREAISKFKNQYNCKGIPVVDCTCPFIW